MTKRNFGSLWLSASVAYALTASAGAQCRPDCNGDGVLTTTDFVCFQAAWRARDPYGDYDGSGVYNVNDFLQFQADFARTLASGGCPTDVVETHLAGNPLGSYPHFEFVNSFNTGATISIGIDPSRYAAIAGKTADAFIVNNKTAAQWAADKTLVDARGAAQAVTFGADLLGSRFALTGSAGLATGAGPDIARAYDLVIDTNRSGMLDSGDFIDGGGDAGGFWVVKDLTAAGALTVTQIPMQVVTWSGLSTSFDEERIYYPSDVASRGRLPLVIVSHGNGHQYIWYDYLGDHMASHGYVVMTHQNQTGPGIETASNTTLYHTDAFLGSLGTIAGGVLDGHVDNTRIMWIGHSRGGEGVARAYDKILDGTYAPTNYSAASVLIIDSIAPTDFLGTASSNPHGANYELLYGSADGDVCGCPGFDLADSFLLYERATDNRTATYVQGADHNDFNCCGFDDFDGPVGTAIGRAEAQQVAKASYLALARWYLDSDGSAQEYLWRQFEAFKSLGIQETTIVDREYKESMSVGKIVLDDFQTNPSTAVASSGAAVTYTVANIFEGLLREGDSTYAWSAADPMNGMARARVSDDTKGVVFDWNGSAAYYETAVPAGSKDLSGHTWLSFRACQQTQHPYTKAKLEDLTFVVTVRDGSGTTASINIGVYGAGIEEVYQRSGGWQNEFDVIRIRLTDFTHAASGLDLTNIAAVRLDFGPGAGSPEGRIGFDDLEVVK